MAALCIDPKFLCVKTSDLTGRKTLDKSEKIRSTPLGVQLKKVITSSLRSPSLVFHQGWQNMAKTREVH